MGLAYIVPKPWVLTCLHDRCYSSFARKMPKTDKFVIGEESSSCYLKDSGWPIARKLQIRLCAVQEIIKADETGTVKDRPQTDHNLVVQAPQHQGKITFLVCSFVMEEQYPEHWQGSWRMQLVLRFHAELSGGGYWSLLRGVVWQSHNLFALKPTRWR